MNLPMTKEWYLCRLEGPTACHWELFPRESLLHVSEQDSPCGCSRII
ncbi:hypothetical protein LEMLEM_LOCUS25452 [Lemmus lemmus]